MSGLDQIRALYEYNEWANGHVINAARRLDGDDLRRELGASFGSVQGNLAHMLGAQNLWLSRLAGGPPPRAPGEDADIDTLGKDLAASDVALRAYVEGLGEAELDRELSYVDTQGNAQRGILLWHTLLHTVNHGTHHRAETALLLTALGQPPRQLEFAFYQLERAGAALRLI
jgi:uncharacterized damage-inducible protein DinB